MVYENGIAVKEDKEADAIRDVKRINYVHSYLKEAHKVTASYQLNSFWLIFCLSLLGNSEWGQFEGVLLLVIL